LLPTIHLAWMLKYVDDMGEKDLKTYFMESRKTPWLSLYDSRQY